MTKKIWVHTGLIVSVCSILLFSCRSTYSKEKLIPSIQKLFRKELGVDIESKLVGKTLYISFQIGNLVTEDLKFPKEAIDQLENAMLSTSRVVLSTDADILFSVLEARDSSLGIQVSLIRKVQDLKDLYYWRISKGDFDERFIWEDSIVRSTGTEKWHDITLSEFMSRWVACRINLGMRTNPFLNILLGIDKVSANYNPEERSLSLFAEGNATALRKSTDSVSLELLRNSIVEQMSQVEKKYLSDRQDDENKTLKSSGWAKDVTLYDLEGHSILQVLREEWSGWKGVGGGGGRETLNRRN